MNVRSGHKSKGLSEQDSKKDGRGVRSCIQRRPEEESPEAVLYGQTLGS